MRSLSEKAVYVKLEGLEPLEVKKTTATVWNYPAPAKWAPSRKPRTSECHQVFLLKSVRKLSARRLP
jgi:hypothetical protein